jgi:flagellar basal-body rod protein FlgB
MLAMDSMSATIILKALDGLTIRAMATSQNIANANSPGYRPVKVTFEDALKAAASKSQDHIRNVQPSIALAVDRNGRSDLRLDLEMATAAATSGRYGALVELLNRRLQIEALAAAGSR